MAATTTTLSTQRLPPPPLPLPRVECVYACCTLERLPRRSSSTGQGPHHLTVAPTLPSRRIRRIAVAHNRSTNTEPTLHPSTNTEPTLHPSRTTSSPPDHSRRDGDHGGHPRGVVHVPSTLPPRHVRHDFRLDRRCLRFPLGVGDTQSEHVWGSRSNDGTTLRCEAVRRTQVAARATSHDGSGACVGSRHGDLSVVGACVNDYNS